MISRKKKYVRTDGWRGYEQPVNAIAGANDTGTWSDSPCNSHTCSAELNMVTSILRKNKIPFVQDYGKTSNVFCIHRYILVAPENREKAIGLIRHLTEQTSLLYLC